MKLILTHSCKSTSLIQNKNKQRHVAIVHKQDVKFEVFRKNNNSISQLRKKKSK